MKLILSLVFLAFGLQASASTYTKYDATSLQLLTYVVQLCPNEIAEGLQGERRVGSAEFIATRTPEGYTEDLVIKINSLRGPPAPEVKEYATLTISRKASSLVPADGGPRYDTVCKLERTNP